jgi:antitoxin component of MazEF toxin-antitoxin module
MANPTRIEVNCETGEVLQIELTDAEVAELAAQAEAYAAEQAAREAEEQAKAEQKATVLAALADAAGLEVAEVTAVLGF